MVSSTMEGTGNHSNNDDGKKDEAPQLSALLKEMKEGLDAIRSKIQSLTVKVWRHLYKRRSSLFFSTFSPQMLLGFI